jgi:hypothetical protein
VNTRAGGHLYDCEAYNGMQCASLIQVVGLSSLRWTRNSFGSNSLSATVSTTNDLSLTEGFEKDFFGR